MLSRLRRLVGVVVAVWSCAAEPWAAHAGLEKEGGDRACGWIGVSVGPMTAGFAKSLGMAEPYGAIFEQPEPGSPAAAAHIEPGDVLTSVNGSPLMHASSFSGIIAAMAPGSSVYLFTFRDGQPREVAVVLGSIACGARG